MVNLFKKTSLSQKKSFETDGAVRDMESRLDLKQLPASGPVPYVCPHRSSAAVSFVGYVSVTYSGVSCPRCVIRGIRVRHYVGLLLVDEDVRFHFAKKKRRDSDHGVARSC